jgi:hypothetical protein
MSAISGCADLCVSCSSAVKTFANLQVVGDEKFLASTYMPPGGCTCQSMAIDPDCPRCFPAEILCQPCGETRPIPPGVGES